MNNISLKKLNKIYLASPRGFCAGVTRAVAILDAVIEKHGPPVYMRHHIVHNRTIVANFQKKGAIFVEDINEIPDGSNVVFSAHGTPPHIYDQAKKKKLKIFDATCPFVHKVHMEAKYYAKQGFFIFYIGHKGHPEPIGVLGEISSSPAILINSLEEAKSVQPPQADILTVLTQTTLSFDDTKEIISILKKRFPSMTIPSVFDICYATQNRQNAVKELAKKADLILVIGSKESSNSNQLKITAEKEGSTAHLIDGVQDINIKWLKDIKNIGITAGASAPDHVINSVVNFLKKDNIPVEELLTVKENMHFPFNLISIQK